MDIEEKKYNVKRYDKSFDQSLRAWSAADEYLLQKFAALENPPKHLVVYNDRFGYLACHLHASSPTLILTQKSQEKAIDSNLSANGLSSLRYSGPLSLLDNKMDCALIKIPKSVGSFQLFLEQIVRNSSQDVSVICAFMTRHFTPKILKIAEEYFEDVEQSRALKKSRLLILNKKKKVTDVDLLISLDYKGETYRQYPGVFSGEHIDYATQFFLDHLEVEKTDHHVLDLGSGNGIIGNEIYKLIPDAEIHLMDDYFVAVSSAKLNIEGNNTHHHFNNDLSIFEDETFDLIASNPPFHFEYEINIQIPLHLFKESFRCLKEGGNLQLVANRHLNYKVHLDRIFSSVEILSEGEKFVVYKCLK